MAFDLEMFYKRNRHVLTWIIFFGLLWLLRGFFGLIFLTFVVAFVAAPLTKLSQRYLRLPRRPSIVLVFVLFLGALTSFTGFVVPRVFREANALMGKIDQIEGNVIELKNDVVAKYPVLGRVMTEYLRGLVEDEQEAKAGSARAPAAEAGDETAPPPAVAGSRTVVSQDTPEDERLVRLFLKQQGAVVRKNAPALLNAVGKSTATMLLALLFAFLISMDIARLVQDIQSLRHSRLHDLYEQTAQPLVRFGLVVGRAIQAQAVIACVNTLLTLIGLVLLGIPLLAVLTLIVFLCSFIPVLGVLISTVPLVLVALNSAGMGKAFAVIVLVAVIHLIEAYLLNPLIYGHHLRLNPVLVLIVLFLGHHTFGVWGMILGVPVTYYFIHDVFGVPLWKEGAEEPAETIAETLIPPSKDGKASRR